MILKSLNLARCGGFEQLDIAFEPDVTLIAGVNGVGKSTTLRALAVLLSRAMPDFTPSRSLPLFFTDDDIHGDRKSLEVSSRLLVADQMLNLNLQRTRDGGSEGDRFVLLRQEQNADGSNEISSQVQSGALANLKSSNHPPLAVYFSPKRQLPGQPRTLPQAKPFEPAIAYGRALYDREVELREFMHWFRTQEKLGTDGNRQRLNVLDALRCVVRDLVPEFDNLRVVDKPRLGFMVDKRGKPFYLHQLSDGERGLLALVFDLTRRLAIANPDSVNPVAEGVALVMIDEIELHLHPSWQRRIVRTLLAIFKRCQFVITTHSPQVIGQVRPEKLRLLHREDNGKVRLAPVSQSFGMDSSWILQHIMGVPARDYETEQRLSAIYLAIDENRLAEARGIADSLRAEIGDFPDLQESIALLDRFELLGRE